MSSAQTTTDHDTIRKWVEERNGKPAFVKDTAKGKGAVGVLRIDFRSEKSQDTLEDISWDDFFKKFDESQLAFLYQEKTSDGSESRFFKLVSRETADSAEHGNHTKKAEHKSESHKKEHHK